jgi:hypothetical protein
VEMLAFSFSMTPYAVLDGARCRPNLLTMAMARRHGTDHK